MTPWEITAGAGDTYHLVVRHGGDFGGWEVVRFKNTPGGGLYGKWVDRETVQLDDRGRAVSIAERKMERGIRSMQGRKQYTHVVVEDRGGDVARVIENDDAPGGDFDFTGGSR